jgi:hypothetical protein
MAKRDAAYWRRRLERDRPDIAARLRAAEIPSVRAAAIEAGFIRERTPLDDLRRAWVKASANERRDFLNQVAGAAAAAHEGRHMATLAKKVDDLQRLAIKAVRQRMAERTLAPSTVAEAIGIEASQLETMLRHEAFPAALPRVERDRIHDKLVAWLGG